MRRTQSSPEAVADPAVAAFLHFLAEDMSRFPNRLGSVLIC
jgi:hypothetical protein